MKPAKVSAVYEGRNMKCSREEQIMISRKARIEARARQLGQRMSGRARSFVNVRKTTKTKQAKARKRRDYQKVYELYEIKKPAAVEPYCKTGNQTGSELINTGEVVEPQTYIEAGSEFMTGEVVEPQTYIEAGSELMTGEVVEPQTYTEAGSELITGEVVEPQTHIEAVVEVMTGEVVDLQTHIEAGSDLMTGEVIDPEAYFEAGLALLAGEVVDPQTNIEAGSELKTGEVVDPQTDIEAVVQQKDDEVDPVMEKLREETARWEKYWSSQYGNDEMCFHPYWEMMSFDCITNFQLDDEEPWDDIWNLRGHNGFPNF